MTLLLTLRDAIPVVRDLAKAEFATIRMRLLKIAVRVQETASRIRLAYSKLPRGRPRPRSCRRVPLQRRVAVAAGASRAPRTQHRSPPTRLRSSDPIRANSAKDQARLAPRLHEAISPGE
jgi:hypothetical protein